MSFLYTAAILVLVSLLLRIGNKWATWKLEQPLFFENEVGAKTAFCAIADAKNEGATPGAVRVIDNKLLVAETVMISTQNSWRLRNLPQIHNEHLFVPFVSNGLVSIESQKKFFITQPQTSDEIVAFIEQKIQETFAASRELRFARFWNRRVTGLAGMFFAIALVASFLATVSLLSSITSQTSFYATDGVAVKEYPTKSPGIAISDASYGIVHGTVVGVRPITHGTFIVCFKNGFGATQCAVSPQVHEVGEEAYYRSISVIETDANGKREPRYIFISVNKSEADALVATGKYRIE